MLNPGETREIPAGKEEPNRCLIFDEYVPYGKQFIINERKHCLLLCIEVFRSEMEYAMEEHGRAIVIKKLKESSLTVILIESLFIKRPTSNLLNRQKK